MIDLAYLLLDANDNPTWVKNSKLDSIFHDPASIRDVGKIINALGPGYCDIPAGFKGVYGVFSFNNSYIKGTLSSHFNFRKIGYYSTSNTVNPDPPNLDLSTLYENIGWLGNLLPTGQFSVTSKSYNLGSGEDSVFAKLITRKLPLAYNNDGEICGCYKTDNNNYNIIHAQPSSTKTGLIQLSRWNSSAETHVTPGEDNVSVEYYPDNLYNRAVEEATSKVVESVSAHFVSR